jgi:hypothetical protein
MNTSHKIRGMVLSMGACLAMVLAGCLDASELDDAALENGDDGGDTAEITDEAAQALTYTYTQDGFKVDWTYVGHPWAASKIAACSDDRIYALNDDYTLYYNASSGDDNAWQYIDYPWAAREIACDGLFGSLFALNDNKDLYRASILSSGALNPGWHWVGFPYGADRIASGGGHIYAFNLDKSVWTNAGGSGVEEGSDSGWIWRNEAYGAERVTGSGKPSWTGYNRSFALNWDESLWYNDRLLVSSADENWHPFPNAGLSFVEISAGAGDVLYGLTTNRDLWKATVTEVACYDGIDNNADGYTDIYSDEACIKAAGEEFCKTQPDGSYCYSRFSSNTGHLAQCSGQKLVKAKYGDYCFLNGTNQDYNVSLG